ncbi:helicase-like transcription factor CHR28 isoform X3 [Magnolia sinica]|uniref:helicase-like transcription factor CHR28 isoform X3 n=1 Tax=Magnolia sinica TaxID=86752 RepID=UPI00265A40D2|nr:helicase-like transcription factor CHR28 isoform X3 [Magnolia sinica]
MPSYVDPLHGLFHSARRCCIFMREWICSSILRHLQDLIGIPVRDRISLFKFAEEEASLSSLTMDTPIDISSSDSENEAEVGPSSFPPGPFASANFRELPSWADISSSNPKSSGVSSQNLMFPTTKSAFNSSSNGWQPHERVRMPMEFEVGTRPDFLDEGLQEKSQYDPRTRLYPGHTESKASLETGGGENDDEVIIYENASTRRFLPTSLMHGKSVAVSQPAVLSDAAHHAAVGEERPMDSDERLIFQAALQDLSQPKVEASLPEGLLAVPLLRHQKIALHWMLQKEAATLHCLGGILADDQGLGKTISMIALIQMQRPLQSNSTSDDSFRFNTEALNLDEDDGSVTELEKVKQIGVFDNFRRMQMASTTMPAPRKGRPAAGTLVVCPASVLRQWARELDEKVSESSKLSVLIYHGGSRTRDPVELAKYDVVLTTYAIVTNEVPKQPLADEDDEEQRNMEKYGISSEFSTNKKRKKNSNAGKKGKKNKNGIDSSALDYDSGPLARVGWFRVVLDEAQTIKNHRTQVARACCGLRAKRRWCLSGTPIQNAIDDLYSYFRFLKYEPYAVYKSFCSSIKHPISRNASYGYKKLQAVLKNIMLRRTKGTLIDGEPIIQLPPKSIFLKKVDFSTEERSFYSRLEADSRSQFKDPPEDAVVTMCGHVFCYQCVSLYLTGDDNLCPAAGCREQLGTDVVFSGATLRSCISDEVNGNATSSSGTAEDFAVGHNVSTSSKIRATLEILLSLGKSKYPSSAVSSKGHNEIGFSPESTSYGFLEDCYSDLHSKTDRSMDSRLQSELPDKAIVFSQWTGMLDLLEISLNNSCIQYRRLDGTMSLVARDRALKDFSTDPEVTVMIMSLKAGNLGLNMVSACHVILLDLWWNPTTEDQAVDRAHRIGQTRPVTVSRLTIKDTVEDRILALQEEKRKMVSSAFGEDQTGNFATRLTVEDLRYLFMV